MDFKGTEDVSLFLKLSGAVLGSGEEQSQYNGYKYHMREEEVRFLGVAQTKMAEYSIPNLQSLGCRGLEDPRKADSWVFSPKWCASEILSLFGDRVIFSLKTFN